MYTHLWKKTKNQCPNNSWDKKESQGNFRIDKLPVKRELRGKFKALDADSKQKTLKKIPKFPQSH